MPKPLSVVKRHVPKPLKPLTPVTEKTSADRRTIISASVSREFVEKLERVALAQLPLLRPELFPYTDAELKELRKKYSPHTVNQLIANRNANIANKPRAARGNMSRALDSVLRQYFTEHPV